MLSKLISGHVVFVMRGSPLRVVLLQFELSRSVLAGFDALAPLTLEALLEGYEATQACTSSSCLGLIREQSLDWKLEGHCIQVC